jgi:hypothetical protein
VPVVVVLLSVPVAVVFVVSVPAVVEGKENSLDAMRSKEGKHSSLSQSDLRPKGLDKPSPAKAVGQLDTPLGTLSD